MKMDWRNLFRREPPPLIARIENALHVADDPTGGLGMTLGQLMRLVGENSTPRTVGMLLHELEREGRVKGARGYGGATYYTRPQESPTVRTVGL